MEWSLLASRYAIQARCTPGLISSFFIMVSFCLAEVADSMVLTAALILNSFFDNFQVNLWLGGLRMRNEG